MKTETYETNFNKFISMCECEANEENRDSKFQAFFHSTATARHCRSILFAF